MAALGGNGAAGNAPIDRDSIRSILVCRPNAKLGNTLLLMPFLAELHRLFPAASIDLVSSYTRAARLLEGMPGLRKVLPLLHTPLASPLGPLTWVRQVLALRRGCYDLAIDPMSESSSGRATLGLARSRLRLGYTGSGKWLQLSHGCGIPEQMGAESLRALPLLQSLVLVPADPDPRDSITSPPPLRLQFTEADMATAAQHLRDALAARDPAGRRLVGYFTGAAGEKALPPGWWRSFWSQFEVLEPQVLPVQVVAPDSAQCIDARHARLSISDPRLLAAAIARMELFLSADTGPMHLASATPVPTVGFFQVTDTRRYAPRKPVDLALDVFNVDPALVAQLCVDHWKKVRPPSRRPPVFTTPSPQAAAPS